MPGKNIRFLEDFFGAYDMKYKKGSIVEFEEEHEDGFVLIVGHGHSIVVPKDKVEKVNKVKFMDKREVCIKMIGAIREFNEEHGYEMSPHLEAELANWIYRVVFGDGLDIGHDEER